MAAVNAIDILWLTAGLGCDGDTIAMTAATQPSIEDIVLGAIPWLPKVNLRNPFLAMENGDEFVAFFRMHVMSVSAKKGEGMAEWRQYLAALRHGAEAVSCGGLAAG